MPPQSLVALDKVGLLTPVEKVKAATSSSAVRSRSWQALVADHKAEVLRSIRTAFLDWIASLSGQNEASRKLHPPSEAFWEPDAWDRFLANARRVGPNTWGV